MKHEKSGRHAPAFILLALALGPNHGLGILHRVDELVPGHRLDTAVIYRVLKKLETDAFIKHEWTDSDAGPKKKVYHITKAGEEALEVYKKDIEFVMEKLQRFLELYSTLEKE